MKKLGIVLLVFITTLSMVACQKKGTTVSAGADRINLDFAWCTDNVDISQQAFYDTATAYVNYLNKTRDDLHIEMTLFDGQATVDKQISDIETAMAKGVDAIILSHVDADGLRPIALQAMEAGTPILDWRDMGKVCTITFITGNEHTKGQFSYQWTKEYLQSHPDVVFYAGLQQGSTNHPQCYPRMQYLYDLEREMPDRFKILIEANSDWSSDTSMRMVEDWLQVYPNMNFISSASEEQMLGVIEALRGSSLLDKYILTCFNGEQTGVDLLKANEIDLDVGVIQPLSMGLLIEYTIRMVLEDLKGDFDISDQSMFNVTQDNVAEYQERIVVDYDNLKYFESTLKPDYRQK
jgi:ABC-type sugar transport system substrate-binding protein